MLYTKTHEGKIFIVCLYIDDIFYTCNMMLEAFKETMQINFDMPDPGVKKYFLGIEIRQSANGIFVGRKK